MTKSSVSPGKDEARFMLRVPTSLRDRITQRAKANGRSMNSEIVSLLETSLNEGGIAQMERLLTELQKVRQEREIADASLRGADQRLAAIRHEITAIAAADSVGDVPEELKRKAWRLLEVLGVSERLFDPGAPPALNDAAPEQAPMSWSEKVMKAEPPKENDDTGLPAKPE